MRTFGGVEAGGTKFSCVLGSDPDHILSERTIRTTTPEKTLAQVIEFFAEASEPISSIGIGSFGPVELNQSSRFYGYITTTPKPHWQNTDVLGTISRALKMPIFIDTDTNVAGLAETKWGSAQSLNFVLYVTVGTGIGGGYIIDGKPYHGMLHPEIGHMRIPHDKKQDPFPGACSFHGDCLEGLASGPAIHKRWGIPGENLSLNHPAWIFETDYVAMGLVNLICTLSPQRIILGGGVMRRIELFDQIRTKVRDLAKGYFDQPQFQDKISEYIVPPMLGTRAGVLGALALAKDRLAS